MAIKEHRGHKYRTRATLDGFVPYIFIGPPHWWRVHRPHVYMERSDAERQAQWAIDNYVDHGKTLGLSILPERRR